MNFTDYFYRLAHEIFKRAPKPKSDAWKLFQATGPRYQSAKEAIFELRRQALLTLATGGALDFHGKDRRLSRLAGESDEEYRLRLLAAGDMYKTGHTKPGMESILKSLGYPKAEVYPLYLERYKWRFLNEAAFLDGSFDLTPTDPEANLDYLGRWAEFIVYLNIGDKPFLQEQKEVLKYVVNKAKPRAAKLYSFKFTLEAESRFRLRYDMEMKGTIYNATLMNPHVALINDRKTLSGDWFLQDNRQRMTIQGHVHIKSTTTALIEQNWDLSQGYWELDGGEPLYQLDGHWQLDAWHMLDGAAALDGSETIEYKHHLGDVSSRLDGTRLIGGLVGGKEVRLDGSKQLRAYPTHRDRLLYTAWKRGVITQKGAV